MINGKIAVYLRAPIMTQSGYGAHGREILDYLLADPRFFVAVEGHTWGNCGFLHKQNFKDPETFHRYNEALSAHQQLKDREGFQYDMAIYVTIPNEFARTARVNIGVTAGIEVDRISREWVHKCNEMDLIVVPSEHSARIMGGTTYRIKNEAGEVREERIEKRIVVINEYFTRPEEIVPLELDLPAEKNLLFVGQWGGKGTFGEDRKNVANLIKFFIEKFKDDPKVGLVLKTQLVNGSSKDREETLKRITEIKSNFGLEKVKCKIHLVHEDLTDDEMWGLYTHPKITGFISLAHGEGFGRPALEAAAAGLPVLMTNWSGQLDFLRKKNGFIPLKFAMKEIPDCQIWEGIIVKGSRWAEVDAIDAVKQMRKFFGGPKMIQQQAKKNVAWLDENFSKEAAWDKWDRFFENFIKPEGAQAQESSQEDRAVAEYARQKEEAINPLRDMIDVESDKEKVLYIMPQSAGDCLMSTAIVSSLIMSRHQDTDSDFYIATKEPFKPIFSKLVDDYGVKIIDYNQGSMFNSELLREVWDYVYSPGVNVQFTFSNWLLGNGEYSVRLLEEFAKNCNLHPQELRNYNVDIEPCKTPEGPYIVMAPGGQKSSKTYKYWDDVTKNIKEMAPDIELIQVGARDEALLDGVKDYRGKTFAESFHIIKQATMLVGVDSFPAHAAAAMETPHLVIYASTHAHTCAPLMIKKKVLQIAIEENTMCKPKCYKDACTKAKNGKNCLSHLNAKSICLGVWRILESLESETELEDDE